MGVEDKFGRARALFSKIGKLRWAFPLVGFLSLVWFMIRVIPKPSRAGYPCQRTAFPIASGFVFWLVGISTSFLFFRRARKRMYQARYVLGMVSFAVAIFVLGVTYIGTPAETAVAADESPFIPIDAPNDPVGKGRGIHPGRVVWIHDADATSWDGESGYWWEAENTDHEIVASMLSRSLQTLVGKSNDQDAWQALFEDFNARRGKGPVAYQPGEHIAIKLNLNQARSYRHPENALYPSPQLVLALLRQLVEVAGVPPAQIALYDMSKYIPETLLNPVQAAFPGVRLIDWEGGPGRQQYERDSSVMIHWSEDLTIERAGGNPAFLPRCVTQAEYVINLGNMKGHRLAGVSFCAKNHFGSISVSRADRGGVPWQTAPGAAGLHPYISVHDFRIGNPRWESYERPMGTYNPIVDLMGHQHLGEKTLLFMVDGLYATSYENAEIEARNRWQSSPFNGDWTSSLFISQDGVAIDSVCLDFLRTEPTMDQVYGSVDNYLHEAALAHNPPSGTSYDPEGDGVPLGSLGAHEHWNNPIDKAYSRNLGTGSGIELVKP
jgi:hypothetical protein